MVRETIGASRRLAAVATFSVTLSMACRSPAQDQQAQWESHRFVVKVCEGVEPCVLPGGAVTFTAGDDQSAEMIAGELFIAAVLLEWGAVAIEPFLQFEMSDDFRAAAEARGILRKFVVYVSPDTDMMEVTEALATCTTHIEEARPSYIGYFAQCPPPLCSPPPSNDEFVCSQWALHNEGQGIAVPCAAEGCQTGGSPLCDADVDAPEAWALLSGNEPDVLVALIDSGVDLTHPDLAPNLDSGVVYDDGDIFTCLEACQFDCDPLSSPGCQEGEPWEGCNCDLIGHGTSVAGVICAVRGNGMGIAGIASDVAKVMPFRTNTPSEVTVGNLLGQAASLPNIDIISMSVAGLRRSPSIT